MRTSDSASMTETAIPKYAGAIAVSAIVLLAAIRMGIVKGVK